MPTLDELSEMSKVNIQDVDIESLGDVEEALNCDSPSAIDRYNHYIKTLKNPYCFLYKGKKIKISFKGQGTLEDNLSALLRNHK